MATDTLLETKIRLWIKACDFEAVFAYGECFRFALRLQKRWGYEIHGIRNATDETKWVHVWAAKGNGKGIDIRGIYPEKFLAMLANDGEPAIVKTVEVQEAHNAIEAKGHSLEFSAELDALADWVVKNHQRFSGAEPAPASAYATFLQDIRSQRTSSH